MWEVNLYTIKYGKNFMTYDRNYLSARDRDKPGSQQEQPEHDLVIERLTDQSVNSESAVIFFFLFIPLYFLA